MQLLRLLGGGVQLARAMQCARASGRRSAALDGLEGEADAGKSATSRLRLDYSTYFTKFHALPRLDKFHSEFHEILT